MPRPVLGRGLGALLEGSAQQETKKPAKKTAEETVPESPTAPTPELEAGERLLRVPIERIVASTLQPRREFPEESLQELAQSIRENGIIQPLVVRETPDGHYELIAGERRLRAAKQVGLTELPVVTKVSEDREVLEMMMIENLQRENLNPIDEAEGYAELQRRFQLTQDAISKRVGKSRAVVANALRLLKLPARVQELLATEAISSGHAKALLGLSEARDQQRVAERIVQKKLSVREVERMVAEWGKTPMEPSETPAPGSKRTPDPHIAALEAKVRERMGTKVKLRHAQGKGSLEIAFYSDEDLQRLLDILGVELD